MYEWKLDPMSINVQLSRKLYFTKLILYYAFLLSVNAPVPLAGDATVLARRTKKITDMR